MTPGTRRAADDVRRRTVVRARYRGIPSGRNYRSSGSSSPSRRDSVSPRLSRGPAVGAEAGGSSWPTRTIYGRRTDELEPVPKAAYVGFGGGYPASLLELGQGGVVVDLGSGDGVEGFPAVQGVGPRGPPIGVDRTREGIQQARSSSRAGRYRSVGFRWGDIERLPIQDACVDVVLSKGDLDFAPDQGFYRDAFRVLRSGRQPTVSGPAPRSCGPDAPRGASCVSGAVGAGPVRRHLRRAGFVGGSMRRARVGVVARASGGGAAPEDPGASRPKP